MSRLNFDDTIVALATPKGNSALAIIRLSGSDSMRILGSVVDQPEKLFTALGHETVYLNILHADHMLLDDVVVSVGRAPNTFTGEDALEISSHGSLGVIDEILAVLTASGARRSEPGEFSQRAFRNSKLTIEEIGLMSSKIGSDSPAALATNQTLIREKFQSFGELYDGLLTLLARINAELDFGESDDLELSAIQSALAEARKLVGDLRNRARIRAVNTGYLTVVLSGPPNAGKSSLFNALLQQDRSIVSPIAGTTRDYLESYIELDGFRVKLVDTAGLRDTVDYIENAGVLAAVSQADRGDLVLYLTTPDTRQSCSAVGVSVHSKSDLDGWSAHLAVSALSGSGIEELRGFILCRAKAYLSEYSGLILSQDESTMMTRAFEALNIDEHELELLSENVRLAISFVEPLLGINVSEDVLQRIFSSLCIGK